uniref:Iris-B n=1 Tax=Drosophila prostipennis TaxID=94111 RepID=Q38PS6_9MUSC|nr:Iris-B [Drosophila prostipennis]
MRSKMKCFLMFLILYNLSSLHSTKSHIIDRSENLMSFTKFNNNLGTFIEPKGQVVIKTGDRVMRVFQNVEAMESDYKYLQGVCHKYYQSQCPKTFNPDLAQFRDTIKKLDTVEVDVKQLSSRNFQPHQPVKDILDNALKNIEGPKGFLFTWIIASLAWKLQSQMELVVLEVACARNNTMCPSYETIKSIEKTFIGTKFTISDFINTAAIKVGKFDNYIVFEYTMPSTSDIKFNLYHLTPIPKVHPNGTIEILDIESPYVSYDKSKMYFNLQNLDDCLKLDSNTIICDPDKISQINYFKDLPCEVAAIRNQTAKTCTSHLIMRNSIWTPPLAPNSWIATLTKELSLKAICSQDEQELKINGTGVLRIRSDCGVHGTSVHLQGSLRKWTHSNQSYASLQATNETLEEGDISASINEIRNAIIKLTADQEKPETIVFLYIIGAAGIIIILLGAGCYYHHQRPRISVPGLVVKLNEIS